LNGNPEALDELYRTGEVEKVFKISRSTLLRYEDQGLITPVYLPSGQRRWPVEEIEKLFSQ
jgi:DNA-binding transcriptional MerR regulator